MKKVFTVTNNIELAPYKAALQQENIAYLVKNEFAMATIGEIPVNESWPQIWVLENSTEQKARELCQALEKSMLTDQVDWYCNTCGENNGANFEFCWQCGAALPTEIN